jgi:tRNA A-37 threonylcarbamoyl transferase component Bud32
MTVRLSDPPLARAHLRELPSLTAALDPDTAREALTPMIDPAAGWRIERCTPGKVLYRPGEGLRLRYLLQLRRGRGDRCQALIGARSLAASGDGPEALIGSLAPLAAAAAGRPELTPFVAPVATIDGLGMAAYAFPIDPDLPTLVAASHAATIQPRLAGLLGADGLAVTVAHYPRRDRCVLRYATNAGTAYGKLYAGGRRPDTSRLAGLDGAIAGGIRVPRVLATVHDLEMVLLEAIPGRPLFKFARSDRERGEAIDVCALAAARLHGSPATGAARRIEDEVASLRGEADVMEQLDPDPRLERWIERFVAIAANAEPLPPRLCHGDFTPAQVIGDADSCGLLDFDDASMAEPAFDVGRFCAYLGMSAHGNSTLRERFLAGYVKLAGVPQRARPDLRRRVTAYHGLALCRVVLNSRQQLKAARAARAAAILDADAG